MVKEEKIKYLEFVYNTINRMSTHSFILKGWAITIISICFAFAVKEDNMNFIILSIFPVLVFWGLDAFYLRQERLFRKLYDYVRTSELDEKIINFSMNTKKFENKVQSWFLTLFSSTILPLYMMIIILVSIILVFKVGGLI